jgi:hypothetical protein
VHPISMQLREMLCNKLLASSTLQVFRLCEIVGLLASYPFDSSDLFESCSLGVDTGDGSNLTVSGPFGLQPLCKPNVHSYCTYKRVGIWACINNGF